MEGRRRDREKVGKNGWIQRRKYMEGGQDSRCGHEASVAGIGEVVEVEGEGIEGVLESKKMA